MADYYLQYGQLTAQEKSYLRAHPHHVPTLKQCKKKAFKETIKWFGHNGHNDASDAFRHCFWSALLSRDIGYQNALVFTNAHESDPWNPNNEKNMDIHNNSVGLQIGRNGGSDLFLSTQCFSAFQQGRLILTP